jgi:hypothetical protein
MKTTPPCPRADLHYPNQVGPYDQLGWYSWAEHMSKTHRQQRCPGCGLFVIWVPKNARAPRRDT